MAKAFADFEKRRIPPGSTCPRCKSDERAGNVSLRLQEYKDGDTSRYTTLTSRTIAMCESCCVEVYQQVMDVLEQEVLESRHGGSRPSGGRTATATAAPRRRRRRA